MEDNLSDRELKKGSTEFLVLALLEHLDAAKVTRRVGDVRLLR